MVLERLRTCQKCSLDAVLIHTIAVQHARRVERLIHSEMIQERYQIIPCNMCHHTPCHHTPCHHTHYERLERPAEEVIRVIEAEKQMVGGLRPYDQYGSLNQSLEEMVSLTKHMLTAKRILGLHFATELRSQSAQGYEKLYGA